MSDEQKITPEAPDGQAEAATSLPLEGFDGGRTPSFLPYAEAVFRIGNLVQEFREEKVDGKSTVTLRSGEINDLKQAYHALRANAPLAAEIATLKGEKAALLAAAKLAIIEASSLEKDTYLSREALDALNLAIGEEWTEAELNQLELLQATELDTDSEKGSAE